MNLIEGNDREILYQAIDESWTISLIALFSHSQSVLKAKNAPCEIFECHYSLIIDSINLINLTLFHVIKMRVWANR